MRRPGKQPHLSKSWMIAAMIGVVFFGLEYGLRYEMDGISDKAYSWLDLTLFLSAYLFFFCLQPLQAAIHRKTVSSHASRRAPESVLLNPGRALVKPC